MPESTNTGCSLNSCHRPVRTGYLERTHNRICFFLRCSSIIHHPDCEHRSMNIVHQLCQIFSGKCFDFISLETLAVSSLLKSAVRLCRWLKSPGKKMAANGDVSMLFCYHADYGNRALMISVC